MNQDLMNQMGWNMQQAMERSQHQMVWVWIGMMIFGLIALGVGAYFAYWQVELMKAIIRALDRWNPGAGGRTGERLAPRPASPAPSDEWKYGPKSG